MGQRTAPPLLLLLLSFNNCFSMSKFVLAVIKFDIHVLYVIVFFLMSMFVLAAKLLSL